MLIGMENNMLSVIVPVFNGEKYIEETVDSILASSYSNIEVILLDDGSTDNSRQICEQFAGRDARVRYIYQKNHGIVAARNRGMELSQGEYICFCDQDDIVEPDMYSILMEKITLNSAQIGMCSTGRLINGQKSLYEKLIDGVYDTESIKNKLLYPLLFRGYDYSFVDNCNYFYGTVWKCIFKKAFVKINNITFRRFVDYEDDLLFVFEALLNAEKVVSVSNVGYYWRVNPKSHSHRGKFIPDMVERVHNYMDFVFTSLNTYNIPQNVIQEYKSVFLCERYTDFIKNAEYAYVYGLKAKKTYLGKLRKFMCESDYNSHIECLGRLSCNAWRKKLILKADLQDKLYLAVIKSRLVSFFENSMQKVSLIVDRERKDKFVTVHR